MLPSTNPVFFFPGGGNRSGGAAVALHSTLLTARAFSVGTRERVEPGQVRRPVKLDGAGVALVLIFI